MIYSLSNIIDNHGTVGVSVVHWRKGLVAFLTGGIPYFELYRSIFIERYGLCKECGADGRLSVVIKLILGQGKQSVSKTRTCLY